MKLVAALGVLLSSPAAVATPLDAELEVERAEAASDCPDADALRARVELIRRAPLCASADAKEAGLVRVSVRFVRTPAAYQAELRLEGAKHGERTLQDRSDGCEPLADAVSVALALSLDQGGELGVPARPSEQVAASPARPARPASTEPREPSAASRPWHLGTAVEGGPAFGFAAPLSWSVAAHAEGKKGGLGLELGVRSVLPSTTDAGAARLRTSWLFAEAAVCRTWGEAYALGLCARFAAGRVHGEGVGYAESRAASLAWLAPGAGVTFGGSLAGPLVWGLTGTLWVPVRRLTFSVENGGTVWRASAVSATLGLVAGVRFR